MIEQFGGMNWLRQDFELVSAKASFLQQVMNDGLSGKQERPALGKDLTHLNCYLDAVHVRHHEVAEENLRVTLPRFLNRCFAVVGDGYVEAMPGEDDLERVGDGRFIVGNKNPGLHN